jgi:hypothetical protein
MQVETSPESHPAIEPGPFLANAPTPAEIRGVDAQGFRANAYDPLERRGDDRRTTDDRDRRSNGHGRREPDRIRYRASVRAKNIGLICSTVGFGLALFAYLHPTTVKSRSLQCGDGIGGQLVVHDQLSVWWIPAIIIGVVGFMLPSARRRSPLALVIAGAVLGLAIASGSGLRSSIEGFCFV